jgi:hypothetical protein
MSLAGQAGHRCQPKLVPAFAEIEELARGRRELTSDTRSKLMQKYGISQETLGVYYNIASSVSKMPNGAQIGAIM